MPLLGVIASRLEHAEATQYRDRGVHVALQRPWVAGAIRRTSPNPAGSAHSRESRALLPLQRGARSVAPPRSSTSLPNSLDLLSLRWPCSFPCGQYSFHQLSNLAYGGQHADEAQRTAANNLFTICEDAELPVVAFHHLHFEARVASQRCRHPGGLNARDSVTAATDRDTHPVLHDDA